MHEGDLFVGCFGSEHLQCGVSGREVDEDQCRHADEEEHADEVQQTLANGPHDHSPRMR
jgi:hypothetical protein